MPDILEDIINLIPKSSRKHSVIGSEDEVLRLLTGTAQLHEQFAEVRSPDRKSATQKVRRKQNPAVKPQPPAKQEPRLKPLTKLEKTRKAVEAERQKKDIKKDEMNFAAWLESDHVDSVKELKANLRRSLRGEFPGVANAHAHILDVVSGFNRTIDDVNPPYYALKKFQTADMQGAYLEKVLEAAVEAIRAEAQDLLPAAHRGLFGTLVRLAELVALFPGKPQRRH